MEERLEELDARVKKLEKERQHMADHLNELYLLIEKIQRENMQEVVSSPNVKIEYLTAANEQMFNQNQRLRAYIEACIAEKATLDQKGYLRALSGE